MFDFPEKAKENNWSVINLIYENNTTDIKHLTAQASIPFLLSGEQLLDLICCTSNCLTLSLRCQVSQTPRAAEGLQTSWGEIGEYFSFLLEVEKKGMTCLTYFPWWCGLILSAR